MQLRQSTSRVIALAKSGYIYCARKLFDEMPHRDTIAYNAMLSGYSQTGHYRECISLFEVMRFKNVGLDSFSFTAVLSASTGLIDVRIGRKIHGLVLGSGYSCSLPVGNSLVDMYGKFLYACDAKRVFDEMTVKNVVSWCSVLFAYTNCGRFGDAYDVFRSMEERNEIAWNTMISGHARHGDFGSSLGLFKEMQHSACEPDQWTYSAVLNACAEAPDPVCGQMIHGRIITSGWSSAVEANNAGLSFYAKFCHHRDVLKLFEVGQNLNQISWNAVIDVYMKMGDMVNALQAFDKAPETNVVSWTSMISGYVRNGQGEQALKMFTEMMRKGLQPDLLIFGAVLHACATLVVMRHGTMIHSCLLALGYQSYAYAGNGLINMYAKCGDIEASSRAFTEIRIKDLISWNTMLFCYGLHGKSNQALEFHEQMIRSEIKPDGVTFIALLMTCSHLGLMEKGRGLFNSMPNHNIPYEADHISIMVDMLGRSGFLDEADQLAKTLPASKSSSEALLSACSAQGNIQMGRKLGQSLQFSEPRNDMSYVLLSNLYCQNGQWKEAQKVREAMAAQGVKKTPGYSSIEVGNIVVAFVAGDASHPFIHDLYNILIPLAFQMKNPHISAYWYNLLIRGIIRLVTTPYAACRFWLLG